MERSRADSSLDLADDPRLDMAPSSTTDTDELVERVWVNVEARICAVLPDQLHDNPSALLEAHR
jgi:hypothetical protein